MASHVTFESVDSRNKYEDLSGVDNSAFENPYEALLDACNNDPVSTLQYLYFKDLEMITMPSCKFSHYLNVLCCLFCIASCFARMEWLITISQAQLQTRYATHRNTRNAQQKEKLLSPEFSGLILDPVLQRLVDPTIEPDYVDPRNCIVFWARPPAHIRALVDRVQQKLKSLAPSMYITQHSQYWSLSGSKCQLALQDSKSPSLHNLTSPLPQYHEFRH